MSEYAIHLFDSPWGPLHARRALCDALRDVESDAETVPVVARWDHPEMCRPCVRAAARRPALGPGRIALRVLAVTVVLPCPVIEFSSLRKAR